MYLPEHFAEHDPDQLRQLIGAYPLGTLVTQGAAGLQADHLPLLLVTGAGEWGSLQGHVARANPLWRPGMADGEVLVIFQGPSAYISPNWYPTKAETHQQVPTYNYAVVHVYGHLVVHEDERWLRGLLGRLTKTMERDQPRPWKMGDAPADYLQARLAQVVGIEIPISRVVGKWKASQNRLPIDQAGATAGLEATATPPNQAMAALMRATATRAGRLER